jgi:indolepyruvate ferredoxin oxidoreductase
VVINDLVCEGCGDCSVKSNCLSVTPVETEFGRKRAIDLSTCTKDRSCLDGFCPSFVTLSGAKPKKPTLVDSAGHALPEPVLPELNEPYAMLVTGIGGTGVVTIGALVGMAAHMEGKAVRVMDMTGLAQKGGSVVSHIQVAPPEAEILSAHVNVGAASLLIGCDAVVAAAPDNLGRVSPERGFIVASNHETTTGQFTRNADFKLPMTALRERLASAVQPGRLDIFDAIDLATKLVGDAVGANLLLLGYAWQRGLVPLSLPAIEAAIELNGVAVTLNKSAFAWGRRAAIDLAAVIEAAALTGQAPAHHRISETLDEAVARRTAFLIAYQNKAYAARYEAVVRRVQAAEDAIGAVDHGLTEAVARTLFQLMAYKDEYEVARLHTETGFLERLRQQFDGRARLKFHMAPPLLARRDPVTGQPKKIALGGWAIPVFRLLAAGKGLRGTALDVFGYSAERRTERRLISDYLDLIDHQLLPGLTPASHKAAVALAEAPRAIKGYGHVKAANQAKVAALQDKLLADFREASP